MSQPVVPTFSLSTAASPARGVTGNNSTAARSGHFAALILARGGSKGIKLKNFRSIAGQPLVTWALRAAIDSEVFDSVWVSTDHADIARVSEECGASVFHRGSWSARDHASSSEAIKEFFDAHPEVEMVAHIQCTSPSLHPWHFKEPVAMIRRGQYDSVFSVTRLRMLRWKEVPVPLVVETEPLNFDVAKRPRDTDWAGELFETGAFYMTTRDAFMAAGCTQGGRTQYFEMDPKYSVDIDTDLDWVIAEQRLLKFGYFGKAQPFGVRLVVFCVEGVLMNNQYCRISDTECRSYNRRDIVGIQMLKDDGIDVRLVAAFDDKMNVHLHHKLGLALSVESEKKYNLVSTWKKEEDLCWEEVAFMGRDIDDIECISTTGVSGVPNDAPESVQLCAKFVAKQRGGCGAVREFCDHVRLINEKAESFLKQTKSSEYGMC
ncbi:N-acylneuraminate cytidylyltransferase A-like [Diadema setosum]|uniref:N-acylneuraminate cytidylyltransferase A-like n=1 Tax=Diadema setosum TaxID=31175 RepID=UPI003B3A0A5D